jgi:hypothetical protein
LPGEYWQIDRSRVSASVSLAGAAQRRRDTVTSLDVNVAIAPPATTQTQYSLSCVAPTAASTCASAQAVLLAAGVQLSGCNVTNGVLRAVVWGDDALLPGYVAAFCNGSVALGKH